MRIIKQYPLSITVILVVIYLSFFKPPSVPELGKIPHLDKVVHLTMYFGMSIILWFESYRKGRNTPTHTAWILAFVFPILFSGAVELLQEYCTSYRGGDWLDFIANSTGVLLAALFFRYFLRAWIVRWKL